MKAQNVACRIKVKSEMNLKQKQSSTKLYSVINIIASCYQKRSILHCNLLSPNHEPGSNGSGFEKGSGLKITNKKDSQPDGSLYSSYLQ